MYEAQTAACVAWPSIAQHGEKHMNMIISLDVSYGHGFTLINKDNHVECSHQSHHHHPSQTHIKTQRWTLHCGLRNSGLFFTDDITSFLSKDSQLGCRKKKEKHKTLWPALYTINDQECPLGWVNDWLNDYWDLHQQYFS